MTTTMVPVAEMYGPDKSRRTRFSEAFADECLGLLDRLGIGATEPAPVARALGVTSCLPAEGVTTIAAETALAAATHLPCGPCSSTAISLVRPCIDFSASGFAPVCETP